MWQARGPPTFGGFKDFQDSWCRLYCEFEARLNSFRKKPLQIHMIYLIEIRAGTDIMCKTNRFRPLKYEFLDRNLFVFHMRSRAPKPPRRPPMMYVVIGSFSHELQMIYVAGARTTEIRRSRGFTGFRVSALT